MRPLLVAIFILLAMPAPLTNAGFDSPMVDIKIVLAVDASGSVDRDELELQLAGISAAFRDEEILAAIGKGPLRKILIAVVIWSDAGYNKVPTGWFLIDSPQSAEVFATKVDTFAIQHGALTSIGGGGTGLGSGLAYALVMIRDNKVQATRRIVDISGDGPESKPWLKGAIMLPQARALAKELNVTVNGLAIETDIADLTDYYRNNVITGPGSFAMPAKDFADFQQAIKKKLLRELSPLVVGKNAIVRDAF